MIDSKIDSLPARTLVTCPVCRRQVEVVLHKGKRYADAHDLELVVEAHVGLRGVAGEGALTEPRLIDVELLEREFIDLRKVGTLILVILVTPSTVLFASSAASERDVLVARFLSEPGSRLLWAWPGRWRTDVFTVSAQDLERVYGRPRR